MLALRPVKQQRAMLISRKKHRQPRKTYSRQPTFQRQREPQSVPEISRPKHNALHRPLLIAHALRNAQLH
jgi:hypothetical protein